MIGWIIVYLVLGFLISILNRIVLDKTLPIPIYILIIGAWPVWVLTWTVYILWETEI